MSSIALNNAGQARSEFAVSPAARYTSAPRSVAQVEKIAAIVAEPVGTAAQERGQFATVRSMTSAEADSWFRWTGLL